MDRRASLVTMLGKSQKAATTAPLAVVSGLEPYDGIWEFEQAKHLLNRTMFGPSYQQIQDAVSNGMEATLAKLMDSSAIPTAGPINPGFYRVNNNDVPINDPYIQPSEPWAWKENGVWKTGLFTDDNANIIIQYRNFTLRTWKTERIMKEGVSIFEKMTLFWHNHFVTSELDNPFYEFLYIITLTENALGNFRELTKKITTDPGMLQYLNGNQNTRRAPNENYARELFELFTIGKGDLAGPGDYTNYTEDDIREAARVLTGWSASRTPIFDLTNGTIDLSMESLVQFNLANHDFGIKNFSHRFDNTKISNEGDEEYLSLVNMIFEQNECARFICRKLYRWFVYYDISAQAEQDVIEPMAQVLIDNDYEIQPALEALLKSAHFYDILNLGPMIKNPYDFTMSVLKPFEFWKAEPAEEYPKALLYASITGLHSAQQMVYFAPPDVAGWKAYYQEPLFYRTWVNSTTLNIRTAVTRILALKINDRGRPGDFGLDVLAMAASIDNATDPNDLIETLTQILFPRPIAPEQKDYLKGILLPGLPDFEWTVEYGDYLAHPDDMDLKNSVEQKLRLLINAMLQMPEFYLS